MSYANPWFFDGKPFTDDDIGEFYGFVYLIYNTVSGKKYIGRKYFYSKRKLKKKDKRRTTSFSDWKEYYGSSKELQKELEIYGPDVFERDILSLHITKGDVNISEVKEQFRRNVLEDDTYLNANINGKWHRPPQRIIDGRRYTKETL